MTRTSGVCIQEAPCCGERYAYPRYVSMNFSAFEYWTDGWREWSPMPNDEGLRRCKCGQYVLMKDMIQVGTAEDSDLPFIDHVPDAMLPECIAGATREDVEVAARLGYWRHLNHPYRERYRQHRDAEEAATRETWEVANPDSRTWWDRFRGRQAPSYRRPPGSPFTYPAFEPTQEQLDNMARLSAILQEWCKKDEHKWHSLELADLFREQGRFEESDAVIQTLDEDQRGTTSGLITRLIKEKQTAPMRYRM